MRRRFKKSGKLVKGIPTAVALSIVIHAALFLLAGMLVVFTTVRKGDTKFAPPKTVERPRMKLKKPKVTVKKTSKPKSTTLIFTKANRTTMPFIKLPEMSGMGNGLEDVFGELDMMNDLENINIFGSGYSIGNDFIGTFYDFKRDRIGRSIPMDPSAFLQAIRDFVYDDWKPSNLSSRYYRSQKKLYATSFMIPPIPSSIAPDLLGEDTDGYCWMVHYKGQLVHKDGITFRFWGSSDDIMLVRVDGKMVLNACSPGDAEDSFKTFWRSRSADSYKYYLGATESVVSDWITLEPGIPLDMEVVIGDAAGGEFCSMLTVEVQGVEYEKNKQKGPILPMFKTADPSLDLIDSIYKDLVLGEASVTNGPVFCDYDTSGRAAVAKEPVQVEPAVPIDFDDHKMRTWSTADGKTFEAGFVIVFGDKAVLKSKRGRHHKIPLTQFSDEDRTFMELALPPTIHIDFNAKSSSANLKTSPFSEAPSLQVLDYVFGAELDQTSMGLYNHELLVEFFAIGAERTGDRYILLDHQEIRFTPANENNRSYEFSGETVRLT